MASLSGSVALKLNESDTPSFTLWAGVWMKTGLWSTVTVTVEGCDVPPAPVQVTEYDVVTVGETDTPTAFEVDPPVEKPVPVHDVALVEDQVSVTDWPEAIDVWLAFKEAVAAGLVTVPVYSNAPASGAVPE